MQNVLGLLRTLPFSILVLGLAAQSMSRADEPAASPPGIVSASRTDGYTEVLFNSPIPFQKYQKLRVYQRTQEGQRSSFRGVLTVSFAKGKRVIGYLSAASAEKGDIVPVPRFLDDKLIDEAASLRDYVSKIGELEAIIQGFYDGDITLHSMFRRSLEADRIAASIVARDAKRRIEQAVEQASAQQRQAELRRDEAVNREKLAEKALQLAQTGREVILGQIEDLKKDATTARENLRSTISLVNNTRRDYEGLLSLKEKTAKEIDEQKKEILAKQLKLDEREGKVIKHEEELDKKEEETLTRLAEKEKRLEDEFLADLRAKWKRMDEAERAEWLITRLSSDEGFKEIESKLD